MVSSRMGLSASAMANELLSIAPRAVRAHDCKDGDPSEKVVCAQCVRDERH